jgi:hypothetical protein
MRATVFALLLALASCTPPAAFAQSPQEFAYLNITGDATTVVKSMPGVLHAITIKWSDCHDNRHAVRQRDGRFRDKDRHHHCSIIANAGHVVL